MRTVQSEMLLQSPVQRLDIAAAVVAQRDATLIAHDNDAPPGVIQRGDGRLDSRKNVQLTPLGNVFPLRSLAIDHTVAIQKDIPDIAESRRHRRASEPRGVGAMRDLYHNEEAHSTRFPRGKPR